MYYFCDFSLPFEESVVSVSVLGSDIFAPTGVESKGGQLLTLYWRSNHWFSLQFPKTVLYLKSDFAIIESPTAVVLFKI